MGFAYKMLFVKFDVLHVYTVRSFQALYFDTLSLYGWNIGFPVQQEQAEIYVQQSHTYCGSHART